MKTKDNKKTENSHKLYPVHVICWDGVEYDRKANKQEIDEQRNNGYVKEGGYAGVTFDFRQYGV